MTGDELRKIREDLGMTQREFAKLIGYSWDDSGSSHISRLETGQVKITDQAERAIKWALAERNGREGK